MDFPFQAIPRWWFAGKPLATHLANGLNLLFPAGERFFIRSVRAYLDDLEDEGLRERVRGFFGQEGHHAREHQRFFEMMEAQGLDIQTFLRFYEQVGYEWLEARIFGKEMRLATTVACEHFTATLAERALSSDFLDHAHPVMAQLLRWHAAEEIEHKSVAFDVLQAVNPSYRLRVSGLVVASVTLIGFWTLATVMLMRQEKGVSVREAFAQLGEARAQGRMFDGTMRRALVEYLRRDFHPSQVANEHLARAYLSEIGRPTG
jgi:predicted metal-dependent hydrolase